jgi:Rod binding domain-containing protein
MAISQVLSPSAMLQVSPASSTLAAAASAGARSVKDTPDKIGKAASDFEALLIGQMLRSAREASGAGLTGADDDDDEANSSLLELGEQQFAQALASSGGLGISKMVVAGLKHAN